MTVTALLNSVAANLADTRRAKRHQIDTLSNQVLLEVRALRKARDRFSEQLAPDFSIFDYLRTNENSLSRCFRDLLDPNGKHGQRRLFLDSFLRRIGADHWASSSECRIVRVEQPTHRNRRLDIYLEFDNGLIGIENKPWAGDQGRQLSDYAAWLMQTARRRRCKYWLLVYLSNTDPIDSSISECRREKLERGGRFLQMPSSEVIEWLREGEAKTKALAVRVFVDQLATFIRINVNRELDMCEEVEIRNAVLVSSENLEAAFLVNRTFDSVKRQLLHQLQADLQTKLLEKEYQTDINVGFFDGKRGCDFCILFDGQQDVRLTLGFDSNNFCDFYFGMAGIDKHLIKSQAERAEIHRVMTSIFGPSDNISAESALQWIWYHYPNGIVVQGFHFVEEFRNWSNHPEPWIAMRDGTLAEKILEIANMVRDAFRDRMYLLMPDA